MIRLNENEPEKSNRFASRDIPLIAAFVAILNIIDFIWIFGSSGYLLLLIEGIYAIMIGIMIVVAAIVINKKFTLLTIGAINTLINIPFSFVYGGILIAFYYIILYGILELFLYSKEPYGENRALNVIAMGIAVAISRIYHAFSLFIVEIYFPIELIIIGIIFMVIISMVGAFIGYNFGLKIRATISSI